MRYFTCPRLTLRRSRWEAEKPFWFTDKWKARVPPEFLKGIEAVRTGSTHESAEETFRNSICDTPPWSLDAPELSNWLEANWVQQEEDAPELRRRRRNLVQQLQGTDGVALIAACTADVSSAPFVRIAQTQNGRKIKDAHAAEQLTAFLCAHAGFGFYYQLFCASSDPASPLLDYSFVSPDQESSDMLTASVRNKLNGQVHSLDLVRESRTRPVSVEMSIHGKAAAVSDHVLQVYHRGLSSLGIRYRITELHADSLRSRIMEGDGVQDESFWRWSSQIARAVSDIHRISVIHLALQARRRAGVGFHALSRSRGATLTPRFTA